MLVVAINQSVYVNSNKSTVQLQTSLEQDSFFCGDEDHGVCWYCSGDDDRLSVVGLDPLIAVVVVVVMVIRNFVVVIHTILVFASTFLKMS